MVRITRRDFLTGSIAAGAALALPHSRVLGANEDIRVAVVGFNGRGQSHIAQLHDSAFSVDYRIADNNFLTQERLQVVDLLFARQLYLEQVD